MLCSSHLYLLSTLSIRNVEAQTDYITMKTLRFIGMAVVAIIMSLNFAACSDDDEEIDVNQLEGTLQCRN